MIASLRGHIVHKDQLGAVIECAGVGYGLAMSGRALAKLPVGDTPTFVLVHTHVSQDALRLFGFADGAERDAFLLLIGVNGVGPRLALAILSELAPQDLGAVVAAGDKAALTRISGVGKKTAERLLLELKDRLTFDAVSGQDTTLLRLDLLSALLNLGFSQTVAENAARQAIALQPDTNDLTLLVREALRTTVGTQKS